MLLFSKRSAVIIISCWTSRLWRVVFCGVDGRDLPGGRTRVARQAGVSAAGVSCGTLRCRVRSLFGIHGSRRDAATSPCCLKLTAPPGAPLQLISPGRSFTGVWVWRTMPLLHRAVSYRWFVSFWAVVTASARCLRFCTRGACLRTCAPSFYLLSVGKTLAYTTHTQRRRGNSEGGHLMTRRHGSFYALPRTKTWRTLRLARAGLVRFEEDETCHLSSIQH